MFKYSTHIAPTEMYRCGQGESSHYPAGLFIKQVPPTNISEYPNLNLPFIRRAVKLGINPPLLKIPQVLTPAQTGLRKNINTLPPLPIWSDKVSQLNWETVFVSNYTMLVNRLLTLENERRVKQMYIYKLYTDIHKYPSTHVHSNNHCAQERIRILSDLDAENQSLLQENIRLHELLEQNGIDSKENINVRQTFDQFFDPSIMVRPEEIFVLGTRPNDDNHNNVNNNNTAQNLNST